MYEKLLEIAKKNQIEKAKNGELSKEAESKEVREEIEKLQKEIEELEYSLPESLEKKNKISEKKDKIRELSQYYIGPVSMDDNNNIIINSIGTTPISEKGNNKAIDPEELECELEKNRLFFVHSTSFFPKNHKVLSNFDGKKKHIEKIYKAKSIIEEEVQSYRHTVHFSLNRKVPNTGSNIGNWDDAQYIIIEPAKGHISELAFGLRTADNFTKETVKLSNECIILMNKESYDKLPEELKKEYPIVLCDGDLSECVSILLNQTGYDVYHNNPLDNTHWQSKYMRCQVSLEHRESVMKYVLGEESRIPTLEDITEVITILQEMTSEMAMTDGTSNELAEELGLSQDFIEIIISHGINVTSSNELQLMDYYELLDNWDNPSYLIEKLKPNIAKLKELEEMFQKRQKENNYATDKELYECPNMTLKELREAKNQKILERLIDYIDLESNTKIILKTNGIYERKPAYNTNGEEIEGKYVDTFIAPLDATIEEIVKKYKGISITEEGIKHRQKIEEERKLAEEQARQEDIRVTTTPIKDLNKEEIKSGKFFEDMSKKINSITDHDYINITMFSEKILIEVETGLLNGIMDTKNDFAEIQFDPNKNIKDNIEESTVKIYGILKRLQADKKIELTPEQEKLLEEMYLEALEHINKKQETMKNVDNMVEQMAQGVDVLGEHIDEKTDTVGNQKGYIKVSVLGIITFLISIGIIILGLILIK